MTRETLPNRRGTETFEFVHGGHLYTGSVGRYADGRVGEVFLTTKKSGELLQALARDAAVVLSIALQHGAPLETIRRAVTRDEAGLAAGACGALVDALAELGIGGAPAAAASEKAEERHRHEIEAGADEPDDHGLDQDLHDQPPQSNGIEVSDFGIAGGDVKGSAPTAEGAS